MKQIYFSKKEIEKLIEDHLKKQGKENFKLFSHTHGVNAYFEDENENVIEEGKLLDK